jgi:ribosomal protein L13
MHRIKVVVINADKLMQCGEKTKYKWEPSENGSSRMLRT